MAENVKSRIGFVSGGSSSMPHYKSFLPILNGGSMKYWFRCMVVAVGLLAWQTVAFADLPDPKGKTENPNVVAARKAIDAKDYKGAVGHLTKAVQELPNDADAHSMLGYAYRKIGTSSINPWSIINGRSSSTRIIAPRMNTWANSISI